MSAVHATQAGTGQPPEPTTRFLDTLYDIIATGVEPGGGVTLTEIEAFVHEHARCAKSLTDFQAFFAQHGLTTRLDHPEPGVRCFLEPLPAMDSPPPPLGAPEVSEDCDRGRDGGSGVSPLASSSEASRLARPKLVLSAIGAALLLLVGAAAAYTIMTLREMRAELTQAQAQRARASLQIEQLDTEAEQLRAGLYDLSTAMQRVEEKHDLVLDSLLPSPVERP
ncbi:MAG: hypothetical protein OXU20_24400 [Myxococcales bacterium]|nr:hypothetical protein [Myxococcales bacterium]